MDSAFIALLFWGKEFESEVYSGHSLRFKDAETCFLTPKNFRHKGRRGGGQGEAFSGIWIQFRIHFRWQLIQNFIYNSRLRSPCNWGAWQYSFVYLSPFILLKDLFKFTTDVIRVQNPLWWHTSSLAQPNIISHTGVQSSSINPLSNLRSETYSHAKFRKSCNG